MNFNFFNVDKFSISMKKFSKSFFFFQQAKMYKRVAESLRFLYKPYALAIVSIGYVLGELGHYLIGKFMIKIWIKQFILINIYKILHNINIHLYINKITILIKKIFFNNNCGES